MVEMVRESRTAEAVLADLRVADQFERRAAALRLEVACEWADLHPQIAELPFAGSEPTLFGTALDVAAEAVAEFAAVHGVSTQAGRAMIADAVELRDRLPKCWERVLNLGLQAWRAQLVAQQTAALGEQATAWVDRQAALAGDRLGARAIRNLALRAIARFQPDDLPCDPAERRWLRIAADTHQADGASWVDGRLDAPDALDLEAAIRLVAADLAAAGDERDLDARRAHALGQLARAALGQPVLSTATGDHSKPPRSQTAPVMLYVHLNLADLATGVDGTPTSVVELGNTGQVVTTDQIRRWCSTSGRVTVRPVIDLSSERSVDGYRPTDLMQEQVALRDRTCVFPWCTRPARPIKRSRRGRDPDFGHDADHIIPFEAGGKTSTDNLACLCRTHHRLKTHTGWKYWALSPGEYLWRSPTGKLFLRGRFRTVQLGSSQLTV